MNKRQARKLIKKYGFYGQPRPIPGIFEPPIIRYCMMVDQYYKSSKTFRRLVHKKREQYFWGNFLDVQPMTADTKTTVKFNFNKSEK